MDSLVQKQHQDKHLTSKTKGCQSGLSRVSRFSGSIIQQLDSEILLLNKES